MIIQQDTITFGLVEMLNNKAQETKDAQLMWLTNSLLGIVGHPSPFHTFDSSLFGLLAMKAVLANDDDLTRITAEIIAYAHFRKGLDSLLTDPEGDSFSLDTSQPELLFLAEIYDAHQKARNDERRAYRSY